MYKFVGPSEVMSSKQIKTEIKLNINLLSKTNKYKTKQTNRKKKYQKEKKTLHECTFYLLVQHMKMSVMSLNIAQIHILHHAGMFCKYRYFYHTYLSI
jgi:hypothetical protein